MSIKLKILGMALLAFAATSAFAATNASGIIAGHFTHEGPTDNAWITGHEGAGTIHQLVFTRLVDGKHETTNESIHCKTSTYTGTVAAKTVQTIQMFPTYTECTTGGGTPGEVVVDVNGCSYTFHSQGAEKHGTVTIDCESGKQIEITHPNCTITIPPQTTAGTLTDGINYKTVTEGKHALTAEVTVNTITGHNHGGICVFLGTPHKYEMKGNVTVKGFEDKGGTFKEPKEGAQINITST